MSSIAKNIARLMAKEGINTVELARATTIPQPTLHKILSGKSKNPRPSALRAIAEYFKVDVEEITIETNNDENQTNFKLIPILLWTDVKAWLAGDRSVATNADQIAVKDTASDKAFATIPNDNVMPQYKSGSVFIFDPSLPPRDGSLVLVELAEYKELLLRQLALDVGKKFIQSLNPALGSRVSELGKDDRILAALIQVIVNYEEI